MGNGPFPQILVVEDDSNHAALIRAVFRHHSFEAVVRIASTGREALDYMEGIPPHDDRAENPLPDVIILDQGLPDMTGFDVLRWLSASEEHSDIPVVMFTSSTNPADERMAYSLGARSYKSKPSNFSELVDTVMDVLHRDPEPGSLSAHDDDSEQES